MTHEDRLVRFIDLQGMAKDIWCNCLRTVEEINDYFYNDPSGEDPYAIRDLTLADVLVIVATFEVVKDPKYWADLYIE